MEGGIFLSVKDLMKLIGSNNYSSTATLHRTIRDCVGTNKGMGKKKLTVQEYCDYERIDYVNGYVNAIGAACADGIDVQGYFCWSFMDNFEWAEGFDKRFGLVYVDFKTQERIPKASAYWYRDMIARFNELT